MFSSSKIDPKILSSVKSPLALFALVILVCCTIFAMCAAYMKSEQLFIYTIHMFMGIIFFIGSIALWAPGCLYHPKEVNDLSLNSNPIIPTVVNVGGVALYMIYQLVKM